MEDLSVKAAISAIAESIRSRVTGSRLYNQAVDAGDADALLVAAYYLGKKELLDDMGLRRVSSVLLKDVNTD